MINWATVVTTVASSGVPVVIYNWYMQRKLKRTAKSREPYLIQKLALDNAAKVNEILREGIDELEEARNRQASEFREVKARLEDTIDSLNNENIRIRADFHEEREDLQDKIQYLQKEVDKMISENRREQS